MAAKNAMVRAAFELQSSHVFEKHSKAWVTQGKFSSLLSPLVRDECRLIFLNTQREISNLSLAMCT